MCLVVTVRLLLLLFYEIHKAIWDLERQKIAAVEGNIRIRFEFKEGDINVAGPVSEKITEAVIPKLIEELEQAKMKLRLEFENL